MLGRLSCVCFRTVGAFLAREEKALFFARFPASYRERLGRHFFELLSLIGHIVRSKFHGNAAAPQKDFFFQIAL